MAGLEGRLTRLEDALPRRVQVTIGPAPEAGEDATAIRLRRLDWLGRPQGEPQTVKLLRGVSVGRL